MKQLITYLTLILLFSSCNKDIVDNTGEYEVYKKLDELNRYSHVKGKITIESINEETTFNMHIDNADHPSIYDNLDSWESNKKCIIIKDIIYLVGKDDVKLAIGNIKFGYQSLLLEFNIHENVKYYSNKINP